MRPRLALLAVLAALAAGPAAAVAGEGAELIGTRPPEWTALHWLGSEPLTLAELRGRVVLVRWWTEGCPLCAASAPALESFHRDYRERGLTVIGLYHHKAPGRADPERVASYAESLGFTFPLAIDPAWQTLRRWWLDAGGRGYTSVTFLLGRDGAVRHIHPGGQYVAGDPAHAALESAVEELLAEPASPPAGR